MTLMSRPQVPLNLLTLTSLSFILTSLISTPSVVASGLGHSGHLHAFRRHGNFTLHSDNLRRKAFGKRAEVLPAGWSDQGCYSDGPGPRTFVAAATASDTMTHVSCINFCNAGGYIYAGVEYGRECYCDNFIQNTGAPATSGCNMPCSGDATEICGGSYRLNVFKSSAPPPAGPVTVASYGNWTSQGCYTDNTAARTLPVGMAVPGGKVTIQNCLDACAANGYVYAGAEYSVECYCGASIQNGGAPATSGCDMTCAGNSSEYCGGPNRLNLYSFSGTTPPNQGGGGTGNGNGNGTAPSGWSSLGCYTDTVASRSLTGTATTGGTMTPQVCATFCGNQKFQYAGVEYAQECYCGNTLGGQTATDGCNMPCAGDASQICGGSNRLNVYHVIQTLPPGWSDAGCYTDSVASRSLQQGAIASASMTHMACATHCQSLGYKYAGVEYGQECYCDNQLNGGQVATDGCNMPCSGDSTEICGGSNRLTLFVSNGTAPPTGGGGGQTPGTPITVPSYGNWTSVGCTIDNAGGRSLPVPMNVNGAMTVEKCLDACYNAGYGYAGTEYAVECYCGTAPVNGAAPATDGCNMACAGNSTELCGGPNRLNMYNYTGTLPPITNPGGGGGQGGTSLPAATTGLPDPWHYIGCWVDQTYGRIIVNELPDNPNLTATSCINSCSSQNYTVAGLEYGVQCFCGNEIRYNGTLASNQNDCNMPCGGDAAHACGAGNRLTVYTSRANVTVYPVPTPKNSSLPGKWQYQGCYAEPNYPAQRTFLHQVIFGQQMTPDICLNKCAQYGYPAAGFEFGQECYCGDITDVATNQAPKAPETDCNTACTNDPASICGGALRLSVYNWVGDGLTTWHTPSNIGRYEFLIGGPIVPLITSLGLNNKVTFLEKLGSGPPNSTHAYELDYTLAAQPLKAWREMHVKTDVFCAGGVMLPDKAGRQLDVGGWSLDSTYGTRLYTPDGSFGVNGTNDWEEDVTVLSLQRGRWYPTAMVMSNGSVLVVGGQIGANDKPEPSLEILPRIPGGPTWLYMDWLEQTDPNNLYPFLHVLPSGGIFAVYYNQARILNPVTFSTVAVMPTLPGSVSNIGGRTYPLEGTGMMFPQHAPYTDPVTMMVCGGSDGFYALDNCVTIQPEAQNPQWSIERMPFPRVMTCMVALPDGTFLIVNGARQGQAGFGLAINPVLTAVLYDPTQPLGSRMSILSTTILPRMYHSEAILLHDGRVLISGSDPLDDRFPEEYRVEVFIPPYLSSGLPQPKFTITQTDWAYNGQYQVVITSTTSTNIRASLIGGGVSTHGNSMGQRTIFPAISCAGTTCTITAPPNNKICPPGWFQLFILDGPTPSYSQWVRIGGDPAHLGEWPNVPGFTLPGM